MDVINKLVEQFVLLNKKMKRWQRAVSVLSAVIVFVTTYALILPAITLDKETATEQPGIEVAAGENNAEESGTVFESEEEPEEAAAEEPAEEEGSESEGNSDKAGAEEPEDVAEEADGEESSAGDLSEETKEEPSQGDGEGEDRLDESVTDAEPSDDSDAEEAAAGETVAADPAVTDAAAEELALITEDTQLTFKGKDYTVFADFGASAKLPVGVQLDVKEITKEKDPELYEAYYEKTQEEVREKFDESTELSFAGFYDISFLSGEQPVEPLDNVTVRFEHKEPVRIEENIRIYAIHFDKEDAEKTDFIDAKSETVKEETETAVESVEFESDKFSVYGILGLMNSVPGKSEKAAKAATRETKALRAEPIAPVTVTVNKRWLNTDGSTATEGIPENATFNLWREKQEKPDITLIISKQIDERGRTAVLGEYSFEPGTDATVRYVYDSGFAGQYGYSGSGEAGYTLDGVFTSVRGTPAGTFSVTAGTADSPAVVVFNDYIWGGNKLNSSSASGEAVVNTFEEDPGFTAQLQLGSGNWTGSFGAYPGEDNDYRYKYYVTEHQVDGWITSYSGNNGLTSDGEVTVTNTKAKQISVTKRWVDEEGYTVAWPEGVTVDVRLQRRVGFNDWSEVSGAVWTLDEDEQTYTFEVNPLDQYDQEYDYRAVETQVDGYIPTMTEVADGYFMITNAPVEVIESIPASKEWEGAQNWTATFVLQWAPLYPGQSAPAVDFVNYEGNPQVTLTSDHPTDNTAFINLPKYGVDGNGDVFRYQYSLDELSYEATIDGETISYNGSEYTGDKYVPVYTHDAGERSEQDDDYHIDVVNAESLEVGGESIAVPFSKTWSEPDIMNDPDAYATFKIKRYVRQAYRDTSHLSERDLVADPVTVTLQDEGGTVLDTISVKPNMGVNVYMVAAPNIDGTTSVSVTGGGLTEQDFTNNGSNHQALIWSTAFVYPAQDMTLTITGDTDKVAAQLLDTTPGTAAVKDNDYEETFTLDSSNNWTTDLDLPTEVLGAVAGNTQSVYYYEYYFEEDTVNAGSHEDPATPYYPHFTPHYNETHRVSTNTSVSVVNNTVKPFFVKKEWHDSKDPDSWPEIRFTLYQGVANGDHVQPGRVFVGPNGERFENVPLNADNDWTWQCPISLPSVNGNGQAVGYYVVESTTGQDNRRAVNVYTNSTFNPDGTVAVPGQLITDSTLHGHRVWIYDYYNDRNPYHAKRTDQNAAEGKDGGFVGNEGTLFISNRAPEYIQFDVKKKWLEIMSDGALATTTTYDHRLTNTYLKIIVLRKTVPINGTIDDTIVDWEEYGQPFYIGYDENKQPQKSDPNNYYLPYQGAWHWQANDTGNDQGLPLTGFYEEADGTYTPVKYYYITRELGVYVDMNGTPEESDYCWYVELLPQAWGLDRPEVFPRIVAQDQDRLVNTQATDLLVEKIWDDTPDNVSEVYVKIWRTKGPNGMPVDFTADIATKTNTLQDYGFVEDPSRLKMLSGGVLVLGLTPDTGSVLISGVPMLEEGGNINKSSDAYHYWIEEVGYKDKDGNVFLNNGNYSAVQQFMPRYTHWQAEEGGGHWVDSWTYNPTDNKIRLSAMGNNKLRVGNTPTIDVSVKKEWYDREGRKLEGSFRNIQAINFKVRRIAQRFVNGEPVGAVQRQFLTFDGSETVSISSSGIRYKAVVSENGSTEYSLTEDTTTTVGDWTTILDGLQELAFLGNEEWHYGYEIIEATEGDWNVTVTGNPVRSGHATVIIKNEDKPKTVDLSITKELEGEEIPEDAYQKLFTVSIDFSGSEIQMQPGENGKTFSLEWDPEQPAEGRPETRPETITVRRKNGSGTGPRQFDPVMIKLLPGETVKIKELPNKASYIVSEPSDSMPLGYGLKESEVTVECDEDPRNPGSASVDDNGMVTVVKAVSDGEVIFVNEVRFGSLKLKKLVTVNDDEPEEETFGIVDGDYTFTIKGPSSLAVSEQTTKYVQITVSDGEAVSYKVSNTSSFDGADILPLVDGWALVTDLLGGDYVITESEVPEMIVSSVTGGKGDGSATARTITVHVTPGDTEASEAQSQVQYTNNKSLIEIKIIKIDEETRQEAEQTKLPNAKFKLFKYTVPTGASTGTYTAYPDADSNEKTTGSVLGENYGTLVFDRLPDGQYMITESLAPSGYLKVENNDFYFDIAGGVVTRYSGPYTGAERGTGEEIAEADEIVCITYTKASGSELAAFTVGNTPGEELPKAGGPGTLLYTLGGLLLITASALMYGLRMRRRERRLN